MSSCSGFLKFGKFNHEYKIAFRSSTILFLSSETEQVFLYISCETALWSNYIFMCCPNIEVRVDKFFWNSKENCRRKMIFVELFGLRKEMIVECRMYGIIYEIQLKSKSI